LLILEVEEVFRDLKLLFLLKASLNSVGKSLSTLQVKLHIDLTVRSVAEIIQDLILLLLNKSVIDLLSAIATHLKSFEKFCILSFSFNAHLIRQPIFKLLKVFHESLLLSIVVLTFGNLKLHCLTCLLYL